MNYSQANGLFVPITYKKLQLLVAVDFPMIVTSLTAISFELEYSLKGITFCSQFHFGTITENTSFFS